MGTVLKFGAIDDLEASLVSSWKEVSRATHRFLVLLREFDLRQGWKSYGNNDCAEWLDWVHRQRRWTRAKPRAVERAKRASRGVDSRAANAPGTAFEAS